MAEADIKVLIVENRASDLKPIRRSLEDYRQIAFEIVSVSGISDALQVVSDRNIEFAIVDASDKSGIGAKMFQQLKDANLPVPLIAIVGPESVNLRDQGAAEVIPSEELAGARLPKTILKLWVRGKTLAHRKTGAKDIRAPKIREFIEEQRVVVERLERIQTLFDSLQPEDRRTYDLLPEAEQLDMRLKLVDIYIEITKIYFVREDERTEELIWELCNQLVTIRFPPRELTPIHLGAIELMLTEPGQAHRQGLVARNRLVFIDILLNLLGQYYTLLHKAESNEKPKGA